MHVSNTIVELPQSHVDNYKCAFYVSMCIVLSLMSYCCFALTLQNVNYILQGQQRKGAHLVQLPPLNDP